MSDTLHDLLQQDEPTALPRIERALQSQDDLSADQAAVLGALVWERCTSGAAGLLGCVPHGDYKKRIDDLESQTRIEPVVSSVFGRFRSSGDESAWAGRPEPSLTFLE